MAFVFLKDEDFKLKMSDSIKSQITNGDVSVLETAEQNAMAVIQDAFYSKYDLDAEFAKTDDARHKNLLRWMLNLTVYFIYEHIDDNQIPEIVVKNYDDTIKEIEKIEQGKRNTSLAKLVNETTDRKEVNFRWGSNTERTHDSFK